ncbi:MAG: DUF1684 domain-containing protein [Propionibacteriaceae bacterium]|nr:DUF1684 domain-containing protein [Propionibacteriaceae bacterium]
MTDPQQRWHAWRQERNAQFGQPYGWLSLTALHWLDEVPAPLEGLPGLWWADDQGVRFDPAGAADAVLLEGQPVTRPRLLWDPTSGPAPSATQGERRLELIERGAGLLGVRVRDPRSAGLQSYAGVPAFDYDPGWRLTGSYRAYPAAEEVPIGSAASRVTLAAQVTGEVDLVIEGVTHTLKVTGDEGSWLVAFRDATSGRETAGACRWIWLDDEPAAELVIDFNFAANPPCAFTDYGTCPLPPAGNTLGVAVLAGERNPRTVVG